MQDVDCTTVPGFIDFGLAEDNEDFHQGSL